MAFKQILIAVCVGSLAGVAMADDAHHPENAPAPAVSAPAAKSESPKMGMAGMQDHMKRMQEQMVKLRAASDPKERERLIDEHVKTMQESMSMMQAMMEMMR